MLKIHAHFSSSGIRMSQELHTACVIEYRRCGEKEGSQPSFSPPHNKQQNCNLQAQNVTDATWVGGKPHPVT